jgi:hypothetical protein
MIQREWSTYRGEELIDSGFHDVTWEQVRAERDQALADSDWRAVKDRTMSQAWKDYRTALRDLPQDHDEANDAADNWPVMPDE